MNKHICKLGLWSWRPPLRPPLPAYPEEGPPWMPRRVGDPIIHKKVYEPPNKPPKPKPPINRPSFDNRRKPPYPSKPQTIRRVPLMTIAAGFRCTDGIVLCSDRLMAHGGHTDPGAFSHYEKKMFTGGGLVWAVGQCGAANDATLLRPFSQLFFAKLKAQESGTPESGGVYLQPPRASSIKPTLENSVADFAAQIGQLPEMALLIGYVDERNSVLLKTQGVIVEDAKPVEILGMGDRSVVDFLVESLYPQELQDTEGMSVDQAIGLSALIAHYAKVYCPQYCGGDTDIYALRKGGPCDSFCIAKDSTIELDITRITKDYLPGLLGRIAELIRQ